MLYWVGLVINGPLWEEEEERSCGNHECALVGVGRWGGNTIVSEEWLAMCLASS